jgi:hypothetical protein
MIEREKSTLYLRAQQLAGEYVVAVSLRDPASAPVQAVDQLVARIHQGMEEAYILGALGPKHIPVRDPKP